MSKANSRLKNIATSLAAHLQVKGVLLLLAAVCWVLVHTSQDMEVEFSMPLDVELEIPSGRTLVSALPKQVEVLMQGKGRNLLVFALFGRGVCRVQGERGGVSHLLSGKNLELEGAVDLNVLSILPAMLPLELDHLGMRQVRVRLDGVVEAANGFQLIDDVVLEPEQVTVTGPQSVLDTLKSIMTEWVEIGDRKRDIEETLTLHSPWPTLSLEPARVKLRAHIEKQGRRRFNEVPLHVKHLPDELAVRPRSLDLTVIGGEKELESLEIDQITAVLDYRRLGPEQSEAPCQIIVPPGFSWEEAEPALFRIVPRRSAVAGDEEPRRPVSKPRQP